MSSSPAFWWAARCSHERREIEAVVRYRYRGHSQGALVSALHKVFEGVDQSPLVAGAAPAD